MRLILIRHGETEHNRGGLTLGRADVPLNERGRAQARAIAASFLRRPAAIVTSPLARAADTARAISNATGIEPSVEQSLIEMDVGALEHLTGAELRDAHGDFLRQWMSPACADARMPGGETLHEVQERAWACLQRLREAHGDGEVVAVTHNFVILMLICRAISLPIADFRRVRQALAARTVVDFGERGATLVQLNDESHLLAAGIGSGLRSRESRA
jgi:broad specificity phosphatase PhoE